MRSDKGFGIETLKLSLTQNFATKLSAAFVAAGRGGDATGLRRVVTALALVLVMVGSGIFAATPSYALEPIVVTPDVDRIEITKFSEHYKERGDTLQVETAADNAGISNRMAVKAQTAGTDPKWIVFALKNPTDKQIVRWVTTNRYNIVGSRILRPDLDAQRIMHVTPSVGFLPLRVPNDAADIFAITLEPGATVTFVAELSNARFPRVFLWEPLAFSKKLRDMTLFNGIMLGIVGILAIFLTAIFVANHKSIFPATAFIAWCVGAYLCVDFGFWHKLFRLDPDHNEIYRAATEAAIAASFVIFLYTFLRLRFWHGWIKTLFGLWTLGQLGLIGLAVLDPTLVSGLARLSLLFLGGMGSLLIGYLAVRGQDRALALVPTWMLFLVWMFGAGVAALGQLSGDIVAPALTSGLVLILVLLGFTVTQFAFRSFEPLAGAPPSQLQLRSLALEGAGAAVWQWNSRRDEISVSPEVEDALGLHEGELTCRVEQWMQYLHPSDRERFRLLMRTLQEKNGGELQLEFRMRGHEGHFLWYELRAHSVTMAHQRSLRCVGLMRDISGTKHSQERLLNDAVHDSLTGLPNRQLFLDRLHIAIARVKDEGHVSPPTVLFVDIDRFKQVNQSFGMVIGDTMLLTIARRLQRHLGPQDSLARLSGDQFAVLLVTENNPQEIALLAERIRRSLRSPMKIGGKEIILTGSIGIAVFDGTQLTHQDLVNEAELAMYRAKRSGTDRIEIFKPTMRGERDNRLALESELRQAIERRQIKILYQPITQLKGEDLTGFEALIRWDHPKHGRLSPDEFIPIAEESDLISELGSYVLNHAVKDAVQWNRILPRGDAPLVVSVNISSRELFRQELYQEVRMILARESLPENSLRLEVTESLVMENPEVAVEILSWLRNAGASLALDDFGTGYSSLSYLHRFPFDTLKVDRSIVHNAGDGKTGPAILRSVVALANELGMDVVAEGVEAEEDVTFLRSIGCGFAQGFYFGEPMNQKDVIYLLEALAKEVKVRGRSGLFKQLRSKSGAPDAEVAVANPPVPAGKPQGQPQPQPEAQEMPSKEQLVVEGPTAIAEKAEAEADQPVHQPAEIVGENAAALGFGPEATIDRPEAGFAPAPDFTPAAPGGQPGEMNPAEQARMAHEEVGAVPDPRGKPERALQPVLPEGQKPVQPPQETPKDPPPAEVEQTAQPVPMAERARSGQPQQPGAHSAMQDEAVAAALASLNGQKPPQNGQWAGPAGEHPYARMIQGDGRSHPPMQGRPGADQAMSEVERAEQRLRSLRHIDGQAAEAGDAVGEKISNLKASSGAMDVYQQLASGNGFSDLSSVAGGQKVAPRSGGFEAGEEAGGKKVRKYRLDVKPAQPGQPDAQHRHANGQNGAAKKPAQPEPVPGGQPPADASREKQAEKPARQRRPRVKVTKGRGKSAPGGDNSKPT